MPKEVTATIMIGPIAERSNHGQPGHGADGRLFCPRHVLTLMEGTRAAWMLQCVPSLRRPCPTRRILPASPQHLLAAALLGYAALTVPELINGSNKLRRAVEPGACRAILRTLPIDDDLASAVFAECGPHVYGIVTALPGSAITTGELAAAAAAGMPVAVPGVTVASRVYSVN